MANGDEALNELCTWRMRSELVMRYPRLRNGKE